MNVNTLSLSTRHLELLDLFRPFGLLSGIDHPTHVTYSNKSSLDMPIRSVSELHVHAGVVSTTISELLPIYTFAHLKVEMINKLMFLPPVLRA